MGAFWTIFNPGVPFLPGLQSRTFFIDLEEGYAAQQNQKHHPQVLTITRLANLKRQAESVK
jgi:hypothetical protein